MPPQHRWYAEWTPERFLRWGRTLGANVEAVIEQVLKDAKYPPQGFRSCLGILSLEKSYGAARLDRACGRALSYGLCSYRRIRDSGGRAEPTVATCHRATGHAGSSAS